jgi:hypothetical protein
MDALTDTPDRINAFKVAELKFLQAANLGKLRNQIGLK